jgi:hypothetical protein
MSEQATSIGRRPQEGESESDLRAEIARQHQEILRLRDLLVGKDAELGAAKGRVAELEDRSRRISGAVARIGGRIPGFRRLLSPFLRLARGQRSA